jgi:glutathione S-transferase
MIATALTTVSATAGVAAAGWYVREKSLRRTHSMEGGLHRDIALPHRQPFELWHNAFSLCSKKVRLCLAELGIEHASHHIDLVETGGYETLSREFLAVNPAGLVPVLVHDGHPVYESHEIIRYAAAHSANGSSLVPRWSSEVAAMEHWVHRSSLFGDHPVSGIAESAGNCIPGLTIPLFAAMIADIPATKIFEGLLFHRLKGRPAFFLALKAAGLRRLPSLAPVVKVIHQSRAEMERHLGELEAQLASHEADWIVGADFTLADVSWAVLFDRLREADWTETLENGRRPRVREWWARIRARPSYAAAMLGEMEHPLVKEGGARIRALKQNDAAFRAAVYDLTRATALRQPA